MCEPKHSIVQYPFDGPNDNGRGTGIPIRDRLKKIVGDWGKAIRDWMHFSKVGRGHSGATALGFRQDPYLPSPTSFEAFWWDRSVSFDGEFTGWQQDRDGALQAATEYANSVAIGNLTMLRRFLGDSMKNSDHPYSYWEHAMQLLFTEHGRIQVRKKFDRGFHRSSPHEVIQLNHPHLEQAISILLGATRKRENMQDAWSDDGSLWIPKNRRIATTT